MNQNGKVDLGLDESDPAEEFLLADLELNQIIHLPDPENALLGRWESGQEDYIVQTRTANSLDDFEYILIRERELINAKTNLDTIAERLKRRLEGIIRKLLDYHQEVFPSLSEGEAEFLEKVDAAKRLLQYLESRPCEEPLKLNTEEGPKSKAYLNKKPELKAEPTLKVIRTLEREEIQRRYTALFEKEGFAAKVEKAFKDAGYLDENGKWSTNKRLLRAAFFELIANGKFKSDSCSYNARIFATYYHVVLKRDGEQIEGGYSEKMFQESNPPGNTPAVDKAGKCLADII